MAKVTTASMKPYAWCQKGEDFDSGTFASGQTRNSSPCQGQAWSAQTARLFEYSMTWSSAMTKNRKKMMSGTPRTIQM